MTTDPADNASRQIGKALGYGIAGDHDRAMELLQPIVDRGRRATYALLCTLAETASMEGRHHQRPGALFGLTVENTATGAADSVDGLPPPVRFAARFVTAWANRDQSTTLALFDALSDHAEEHGTNDLGDAIGVVYDMAVTMMPVTLERLREERGR